MVFFWYPGRADSYFSFASGLVTARMSSMKSSASGLSKRFLRLIILIVLRAPGNSTGKALTEGSLPANESANSGIAVRKRPVAASLARMLADSMTTVAVGGASPRA